MQLWLPCRHQVVKYYAALSLRKPSKKQGLIRGDMAKSRWAPCTGGNRSTQVLISCPLSLLLTRNGTWKLLRSNEDPAVTKFGSLGLPGVGDTPGLRLFLMRPETGRTHQLRVAMKAVGAPILGDEAYGGEAADRAYLHATALALTLESGERVRVFDPPAAGELFVHPVTAQLLQGMFADPGSDAGLNEGLVGLLGDWRAC